MIEIDKVTGYTALGLLVSLVEDNAKTMMVSLRSVLGERVYCALDQIGGTDFDYAGDYYVNSSQVYTALAMLMALANVHVPNDLKFMGEYVPVNLECGHEALIMERRSNPYSAWCTMCECRMPIRTP
jgi:hypothetical protein